MLVVAAALDVLINNGAAKADNRNAIQAATDAFGVTVGIENIGLYTNASVRGFSPTTAGNVRIDGLYFDQAGELNRRLVDLSTIRVGIAAQAYPFPAPTGIVDNRLRTPGSKLAVSGSAGFADYGGPYFDTDLQIPLKGEKLGLAVGFGRKDDEFPDGTNSNNRTMAFLGNWEPAPGIRLRSFWTQMLERDFEAQPLLTLAGDSLPPELTIRKFIGQEWAANRHRITNTGALLDVDLGDGWALRAGLFRSMFTDDSLYSDLFRNVQPDGSADHLIVANPRQGTHSTSGEVRLSHAFNEGPRRHSFIAIIRGRVREADSGGSDQVDFGQTNVLVPQVLSKPGFELTRPNRDKVRQLTAGLAYEGDWSGIGRIGIGLQKTRYRKTFDAPGNPPALSSDSPLLFYGTLETQLNRRVVLFGSLTRGLEETGIAPDNAVNHGQPLAAARTRQVDGGLSYSLTDKLKLVAGAFDVQKPYFNLDANNVYTALGTETHRGIEVSVTGSLSPRLSVVAGAVLMDARVTGQAVNEGLIGKRPINTSPQLVRLSAEYLLPALDGASVDMGLDYDGRRVASANNRVSLPARTILRVGGRYRFRINRLKAQFRILIDNVTDEFSWALTSGAGFKVDVGRRVTGYLAVDL